MPSPLITTDASTPLLHPSGAVARRLRLPVATLRVPQRRYASTQPELMASGRRLCSANDAAGIPMARRAKASTAAKPGRCARAESATADAGSLGAA